MGDMKRPVKRFNICGFEHLNAAMPDIQHVLSFTLELDPGSPYKITLGKAMVGMRADQRDALERDPDLSQPKATLLAMRVRYCLQHRLRDELKTSTDTEITVLLTDNEVRDLADVDPDRVAPAGTWFDV